MIPAGGALRGRATARCGPPASPSRPDDATALRPAGRVQGPRYTGVRTFGRCPNVLELDGVDVAAMGIPFDTATSNRPGARFGPEAIVPSIGLRPYHPALDVDVFAALSVVDRGDVDVTPGNAERTAGQIAAALEPVVRTGVVPLVLGGDHSIVLGELCAHAAVHGAVALVLLDAHADTGQLTTASATSRARRSGGALQEGLLAPSVRARRHARPALLRRRPRSNA